VETILKVAANIMIQRQRPSDHFIGGWLVKSPSMIPPRINASHLTPGGGENFFHPLGVDNFCFGCVNFIPRKIESRIVAVAYLLTSYIPDVFLGHVVTVVQERRIQNRKTGRHILTVAENVALNSGVHDPRRGYD